MKRFALLILGLVALASPAMAVPDAHVGDISIYADAAGNSCDLTYSGGLSTTWHIVHKIDPGEESTGARFKLVVPAGLTIVGFSTQYVTIGQLATDLSIAYGFCVTETIDLGTATIIGADPPACSYASVVEPDVILPTPIATDCNFGEYEMKTGQGIINGDGSCPCSVKTEPTTWGKVKALYR